MVQIYENQEYIQGLIEQESPEIIKLLIYGEGNPEERKIETSRIKSLLTKAKSPERGWRRDFSLVKEENWKTWWKNVNEKLKTDPWFDTPSESVIILREKPVSKAQNMYEQFLVETHLKKKFSICEQVIELCNKDEEQTILKDLAKFITISLKDSSQDEVWDSAIFNALQLSEKGINIEPFSEKAYELTFSILTKTKLSSQKILLTYSFFSKLPLQNITDHLIIFLHGDKNLRKAIRENFRDTNGFVKRVHKKTEEETFAQAQISAINALKVAQKKKSLHSGLEELIKLKESKHVTTFLNVLLLTEHIDYTIQEAVSQVVAKSKMTSIIYTYLNKVQVSGNAEITFLPELLNVLGAENAERSFIDILLNEKTPMERPNVFIVAFRCLAANTPIGIDDKQRQRLIAYVNQLLSDKLIGETYDDLRGCFKTLKTT